MKTVSRLTKSFKVSQSTRIFIEASSVRKFNKSGTEVTRSSIVHQIEKVNPVRTSAIRSRQRTCVCRGSIVSLRQQRWRLRGYDEEENDAVFIPGNFREKSARNYSSLSFQEPQTYRRFRLIEEMTPHRSRSPFLLFRSANLLHIRDCYSRLVSESLVSDESQDERFHHEYLACSTAKRSCWKAARRQA